MTVEINVGSYSRDAGLQLPDWLPGYSLGVAAARDEVSISGNAAGLRSLAQHLVTLADDGVPAGVHAHLQPAGVHAHLQPALELDDDSVALIVDKRAPG